VIENWNDVCHKTVVCRQEEGTRKKKEDRFVSMMCGMAGP
jgi:hypothetical protein